MGRKLVFERPRMTSITIDVLDAEIIKQYKYTNEPIYRTVTRIMRTYAPPDVVEKCKQRLAAIQKNAKARIDRYGQSTQASLTKDDEQDKPSERYPDADGILKEDYIAMIAETYKVRPTVALEEIQKRIKKGQLIERYGCIKEVVECWPQTTKI